jgi:hypothetical protein
MVKFSDLVFKPHDFGICLTIAKYGDFSIITGAALWPNKGYEVMDQNGEVHKNLTEKQVEDMLNCQGG